MSLANIITLLRAPLLLAIVAMLYVQDFWFPAAATALLPILYLMDWFDGYVARMKNQVTDLGSVLDIAIDRVVENALWVVFVDLDLAPLWVAMVFIIRSFVVDGMRGYALSKGKSAFGMMSSPLGRFLVAGRLMRGLYGLVKGAAFCVLAAVVSLGHLGPSWDPAYTVLHVLGQALVYLSALLCIIRGLPVIWDIRPLLAPGSVKDK